MVPAKIAEKKGRDRFFRYAPILLWILLIFYASTSQGSVSQTSFLVRPVLEFLFPGASPGELHYYHFLLRKSAHILLYSVLGILAFRAFSSSSAYYLNRHWPAATVLLIITIAATDELNQNLNSLRTGSIDDVILDCISGFIVVALLAAVKKWRIN